MVRKKFLERVLAIFCIATPHSRYEHELGEVQKARNDVHWLAPSNFFLEKGGWGGGRCAYLESVQLNRAIR